MQTWWGRPLKQRPQRGFMKHCAEAPQVPKYMLDCWESVLQYSCWWIYIGSFYLPWFKSICNTTGGVLSQPLSCAIMDRWKFWWSLVHRKQRFGVLMVFYIVEFFQKPFVGFRLASHICQGHWTLWLLYIKRLWCITNVQHQIPQLVSPRTGYFI